MSMPAFARRVMELEKKVKVFEAYRYMRIGGVVDVTAPDLPLENCMWADGSLALFDFWPELKAKYENGGFSGLLLPCDCSDEDKTTYPLKWVPDSPNPTGLFVPRLIGLFARYWGQQGAGKYNAPGIPNITGGAENSVNLGDLAQIVGYPLVGALYPRLATQGANFQFGTTDFGYFGLSFDASRSNAMYGSSDTVMPASADIPVALYLGRRAEV